MFFRVKFRLNNAHSSGLQILDFFGISKLAKYCNKFLLFAKCLKMYSFFSIRIPNLQTVLI